MNGSRPWSWIKIALLVILALIIVMTIYALDQG
jgi:uncharacterized membrane protein